MLDGDARNSIDLNGDGWEFGSVEHSPDMPYDIAGVTDWLPARVPGNVRNDLMAAGRIPDPYYGLNLSESAWVEQRDWWYRRKVSLPLTENQSSWCAHLIFAGIDYISAVFWNGEKLGEHEGMFSRQVYSLYGKLLPENILAVRIRGSAHLPARFLTATQRLLNRFNQLLNGTPAYPDRSMTVKSQMGFGWDFAPPLRSMGIWDDISLVLTRGLYLAEVSVSTIRAEPGTDLEITVMIEAAAARAASIEFILLSDDFIMLPLRYSDTLTVADGRTQHTTSLHIPSPQFWQPWERGRPTLYRLEIILKDRQSGQICDRLHERIGVRTMTYNQSRLDINGRPFAIRGANWVPVDAMAGRVSAHDYTELIRAAKAVGINMLRVWGGGLREKRAFYDICDQEGMLVWQEMPFACIFLGSYPDDRAFLRLAGAEAGAIVRELRNHPSIVLWCGGNEYSASRNRPLVETIAAAIQHADPGRPFIPVSPGDGDSHNWRVWHRRAPLREYRNDSATMVSEFGLQSVPNPDSLACFLPPEHRDFPDRWWEFHNADLSTLWYYSRPFLQPGQTVDAAAISAASQRAQAYALQIMIEHVRRRQGNVLFWQFNEPWPAISWAVLDYYRHPKLAYHWLRAIYAPLMVSLAYPLRRYEPETVLEGSLWIINDSDERIDGCRLEVIALPGPPQPVDMNNQVDPGIRKPGLPVVVRVVAVEPHQSIRIHDFRWRLPPYEADIEGWMIQLRLWKQGRLLAINSYDLTFADTAPMPLRYRFRAWAIDWLLQ